MTVKKPLSLAELKKGSMLKKGKFAQNKRGSYYCDHCKMHGHNMERCWKINGYSRNYKLNTWKKDGTNKGGITLTQPQVAEGISEPKLTQEQYNKLMCLLSKQSIKQRIKTTLWQHLHIMKVTVV